MGGVLVEVHDAPGQAARMQARPDDVHRRLEQLGRDELEEGGDAGVGLEEVPRAVDDEGGTRLVVGEDDLDRLTDAGEFGGVER